MAPSRQVLKSWQAATATVPLVVVNKSGRVFARTIPEVKAWDRSAMAFATEQGSGCGVECQVPRGFDIAGDRNAGRPCLEGLVGRGRKTQRVDDDCNG